MKQSLVRLRLRLRALFRPRATEQDLDDELRFHIEMQAQQNQREGMSPANARRAALLAFGGFEQHKEAARDARGIVRLLDDAGQDLRFAVRTLRRSPAFTTVALLTLTIGIGMTTAIYSVVDGVLLRPLPYPNADRITVVWENDRISGTEREAASIPDYFDFRARSRSFQQLAAFSHGPMNLTGGGEPEQREVAAVSHELFEVLGVRPLLGRRILPADDQPGAASVAVIGEALWRSRFGGDRAVIGKTIHLDERPYVIVGVLPGEVDFPTAQTDAWIPARLTPTTAPRSLHSFTVIGRLRPDVAVPAAQNEMTRIAAQLEEEYTHDNHGRGVFVEPLAETLFAPARPALLVLLGAVALVLLIACANVANLLLARGTGRVREVAVRKSLGAGSRRIARQFIVENLLLTFTASIAGVLLARFALGRLLALAPAGLPRRDAIGIDPRVLAVTLAVSIVVALIFGLLPTLRSLRLDIASTLKAEGGRTMSAGRSAVRGRSMLVVAEIALALVLVVGAGLLIRSFTSLTAVDPGFEPEGVLRASFRLPSVRYPQDYAKYPQWTEVQRFHSELLGRVRTLPGVRDAAIAAHHPLAPGFTNSFLIVGREEEAGDQAEVPVRPVSPTYFATAGVPLLRGRVLSDEDRADAPGVLVVNDAFVRRYFANEDPIGRVIRFWGVERAIVGVVGDEHFRGLAEDAPDAVYPPIAQAPFGSGTLLVRTAGDPSAQIPIVRETVRSVDADLALFDIATLEETVSASVGQERFTMLVLTLFAGVALMLALIGVHGVLSFVVAQRVHEFGIRMALGASTWDVLRLVLVEGSRMLAAGLTIGVLGALAGSRLLAGLLFGVTTTDLRTYAIVILATAAVTLIAILLPAWRATAASPMRALRAE